jgi:hypothetical protein
VAGAVMRGGRQASRLLEELLDAGSELLRLIVMHHVAAIV